MPIPPENALAFFPPSYRSEGVVVGPLTLAHVVRLSAIGVDIGRRVPEEQVEAVAGILEKVKVRGAIEAEGRNSRSVANGLREQWMDVNSHVHLSPSPSPSPSLSHAVEKVLNDAFETYLKPLSKPEKVVKITPTGLGWPLEMAEYLCSEYGWGFNEAINTPVATAFALIAACRQRNGVGHSGFDYVEREYARSLKKNG